jgi:hypothetical protein
MVPGKAAILDLLTHRARICAEVHNIRLLARHGIYNREVCRRATRELVADGHLGRKTFLAREPLELEEPIVTCYPGDAPFDFDAVAWQLEKRGNAAPLVPIEVFFATTRSVNLLGGYTKGRPTKQAQSGHDLLVPTVFLRLLDTAPALAAGWVGEDGCPHLLGTPKGRRNTKGEKQPDAMIFDSERRPVMACEIGGLYGPGRLRSLYTSIVVHRSLALQLW